VRSNPRNRDIYLVETASSFIMTAAGRARRTCIFYPPLEGLMVHKVGATSTVDVCAMKRQQESQLLIESNALVFILWLFYNANNALRLIGSYRSKNRSPLCIGVKAHNIITWPTPDVKCVPLPIPCLPSPCLLHYERASTIWFQFYGFLPPFLAFISFWLSLNHILEQ
jgi:hypothetical protein